MEWINNIARFLGHKVDDAEIMDAGHERLAYSNAAKRLALYIAVSYVSNALSKCEIKTYENGKPVKGELYWALNISPNPNQSGSSFINDLVESYFYEGHALMVQPIAGRNHFYIATNFGIDRRPLQANRFTGVTVENQAISKQFDSTNACYFKLESTEVRAVVNDMYRELGELLGMSMESYKNANGERFIYTRNSNPGGMRSDEENARKEVNDRLKEFVRHPNGVLPLYSGQTFTRLGGNGEGSSADVIALRKDIFEVIANAIKIPQSMMYGNMTNTNDVLNQFITFGVDPIADMISREMTRGFYDFRTWRGGDFRIQVDTSKIAHLDMFQVADKADKLIGSGAFSIDEVRAPLGADPLNTEFSQAHWVTKNYSLIQEALQQLQASTDPRGGE